MKKLIVFLFMLIAVNVNAQHLKFMGFPIDGNINNFQAKLGTKGIVPDQLYNKQSSVGNRAFTGVFCGYKAQIYTYYNTKTKVVYRSKACIESDDINYIKRIYNEIKDMLNEKYLYRCDRNGTHGGYDSYSLLILHEDEDDCDWSISYGSIDLYISTYSDSYPTKYTLHIDYTDRINSDKNTSSNSDDL